MGRKQYGQKKFLNKSGLHSIAAIGYSIELEQYPGSVYVNGSMWVSDCSRQITLDLSWTNRKTFENTLFKLETARDVIEQAIEDVKTLDVEYKAKEKKRKLRKKRKQEKELLDKT